MIGQIEQPLVRLLEILRPQAAVIFFPRKARLVCTARVEGQHVRVETDHELDDVETLAMVRTPDILAELGKAKDDSHYILVGFAAETEDLLSNATEKLKRKNLDMILANDVSREDAGFATDTNLVKILHRDGHMEELPLMSKEDVADQLLDRIKDLWKGRS